MVIEHEKKRRQRYDLILRLRPDEFFCTPLPRHGQVDWLGATILQQTCGISGVHGTGHTRPRSGHEPRRGGRVL